MSKEMKNMSIELMLQKVELFPKERKYIPAAELTIPELKKMDYKSVEYQTMFKNRTSGERANHGREVAVL